MVRYLVAALLVRFADEGSRVALVLLGLAATGDPAIAGLLVAVLLVPHVVAAPLVGWLIDRARRPRWLLAGGALGFAAALAAATLLDVLPLGVVLAVLAIGGCCGPVLTGGMTSRLAGLVPAARLPRAYGADSLTYNVAGLAGPALAGTVAALVGAQTATAALAGMAAVGAVALLTVPFGTRSGAAPRVRVTSGIRVIVGRPVLRTVTLASSAAQLGPGALAIVTAVLATAAGAPGATGWMLTAVAAGGLVGSLVWTWRPAAPERSARVAMLSLVGVGVPLAVSAATTGSLLVTGILFAVSGVFLGPATGALFTTRHRESTPDTEAQVFTLSAGLKITSAAVGAALGGLLAGLPAPVQLLLVAASPLVAGAVGLLALPRPGEAASARPDGGASA